MHYQDEGCENDNDYGLPPQYMGHVHIYSVFTVETSFNPAEYKATPHTISPSCPDNPEACWYLTFDKMPPLMLELDSG